MRGKCAVFAVGVGIVALSCSVRGAMLINEILPHPQAEASSAWREFVEFLNTDGPGSATNLWFLQIDGNGPLAGNVHDIWDLSALSFGPNGLLLIGNNYDDPPLGGPWSNCVSSQTSFGDPTYFGAGDLLNTTYTWMLVSNLNVAVTNGMDLDADNDGVLDSTPWDELLDSVGWQEKGSNGLVYSAASLIQPTIPTSTPDGATRFPTDFTPNSKDAWYNGDVTTNATDAAGRHYLADKCSTNLPVGAYMTPGDLNFPVDFDGDGMLNSWEQQYFGGYTNATAGDDPDHDNFSNWREFVAGTDPNDPASYLGTSNPVPAGADAWSVAIGATAPNRQYGVVYSTNLYVNNWITLGSKRWGTGGPLTFSLSSAEAPVFFRTSAQVQP